MTTQPPANPALDTTVSAIETGRRRVDVVELRTILVALGPPASAAVATLDAFDAVLGALSTPD